MSEFDFYWLHKESYYENFIKNCKEPIILFGASEAGKYAFDLLNSMRKQIKYFSDNDNKKCNTIFCNRRIISPDELNELNKNIIILITSIISVD
ncbi:hypothetical protein [Clostridium sp.]|uniref:hypothetical protein n=1 Tax=Clostridium sp. TaxID=1506 RepID=UPI002FDE50E4